MAETWTDVSPKGIQMVNRPEKMLNMCHHQKNANQNYNEIPPHTSENGKNQQPTKQVLVRMWRKTLTLGVGMQTGAATENNSIEAPQKLKIDLPYIPEIMPVAIYQITQKH